MAVSELKGVARTFEDVAALVREVHVCLHTVEGKVDTTAQHVTEISERLARVEGYQEGVASKLGVPTPTIPPTPPPPPPGFFQKHKTPITTVGATIAAMTSFAAGYPFLRGLFGVLDHYLTHAPK
jgi:hypothetical protein